MSTTKKLEVGSHNKLPHYSIIGQSTNFYIWVNEDSIGQSSSWIKGQAKLYHELLALHSKKKQYFINKLKATFKNNKK